MQRRTFLRIFSAAAIATTAGGMGGWWLAQARRGVVLSGRALFPGVPLHIQVMSGVPQGAKVRLVVDQDGQAHVGPAQGIAAGDRLVLETPYPHEELKPGTYLVAVELLTVSGEVLERHDAGGYQLGKQWFSA